MQIQPHSRLGPCGCRREISVPPQQSGKERITFFFFVSCFLASHLGKFRNQPGNKSQDNSSSAGQPAEPKAAANAIPSRTQSTARYSHLQSSNQPPEVWSMCCSSLRWKRQGLTQEIAWRLKLTASSRIWATVREVHLQIQLQHQAGAAASPSTG